MTMDLLPPAREQRAHPSERFILFLLTQGHPEKCSYEFVKTHLEMYRLPEAEEQYVSRLRAQLLKDIPNPFLPRDRRNIRTARYLRRHRIFSLHHPTRAVEEANTILLDFRVRRRVEVGLLGQVPFHVIAREVGRAEGLRITTDGVQSFAHYYWNVRAMSLEEWSETILSQDLPPMVQEDHEVALRSGREATLHRMGLRAGLEGQEMLQDMRRRLYINFVTVDDTVSLSRDKITMLTGLANTALAIDKRVATSEDELRRLLKDFERMRVQNDKQPPVSLHQLADPEAGGTYSDTADVADTLGEDDDGSEDIDEDA